MVELIFTNYINVDVTMYFRICNKLSKFDTYLEPPPINDNTEEQFPIASGSNDASLMNETYINTLAATGVCQLRNDEIMAQY